MNNTRIILSLSLVLLFTSCSLHFIKTRLSPPQKVEGGILFQYDAPSARQVNLAGNFPDNEWLKNGMQVDLMHESTNESSK